MDGQLLTALNTWFWIVSNILVLLLFVFAGIFSIGYPLLFKITTTGGWRFWRAILSIFGFGLLAFLGTFIDPQNAQWWELPSNIAWWRPLVRLLIFGVITHSFASLASYLLHRRFSPQRLVLPPEVTQLMESDLRLQYGSGSGLPDPHTVAMILTEAGWTKPGLEESSVNTLGVLPRRIPRRRSRA